eukprot:TRINITY_DN44318_c0_g1_i1.p1 TRINITY_DN44318_c0_g1~~TRINITY_DN44318_c0_g1_i1.p1  ORF type:complete len:689 (-),score=93.58 TRINITY_DN44318_c0_g1_i1:213-2168(-)
MLPLLLSSLISSAHGLPLDGIGNIESIFTGSDGETSQEADTDTYGVYAKWSCAADSYEWHSIRETARYLLHPGRANVFSNAVGMNGLIPLWTGRPTATQFPHRLGPGKECPVGEAFLVVVDRLMEGYTARDTGPQKQVDMTPVSWVLSVLQSRVPLRAAIASTWPLFFVLALVQQMLSHKGAIPASSICREGRLLAAELRRWLSAPALPGALPSLERLVELAMQLRDRNVKNSAADCSQDPGAAATMWLAIAFSNAGLAKGANQSFLWPGQFMGFDHNLDHVLGAIGWANLFNSPWPVLAMLDRLQQIFFYSGACELAEHGAYGVWSRAEPRSVWICIRRRLGDVVDERWRMQGSFPDCFYIVKQISNEKAPGCLVLDIGANLGGCSLALGHVGFEVLAFEPVPALARLLMGSIMQNQLEDKVFVLEAAVGMDAEAFGQLVQEQGHSATAQVMQLGARDDGGGTVVRSVSLDRAVAGYIPRLPGAQVCAVKVDVEGSEEEVLRGGIVTLAALKPTLFLDLHPRELRNRGSRTERVIDLIVDKLGYRSLTPFSMVCKEQHLPNGTLRITGNGVYPESMWPDAVEIATLQTASPCVCSSACLSRIVSDRCRCWEIDSFTSTCRLLQHCVGPPTHKLGWLAAELSGNIKAAAFA